MSILDEKLEDNKFIDLKYIVNRRFFRIARYKTNPAYRILFDAMFDALVSVDNNDVLDVKDYYKNRDLIYRMNDDIDNLFRQFSMDVFFLDFYDALIECIFFLNKMQIQINSIPQLILSDNIVKGFTHYKVNSVNINKLNTLTYNFYNKKSEIINNALFNIGEVIDFGASIQIRTKIKEHVLLDVSNILNVKSIENFHLSIFDAEFNTIDESTILNFIRESDFSKLIKMPIKNLLINIDNVFFVTYDENMIHACEDRITSIMRQLYITANIPYPNIKVMFRA